MLMWKIRQQILLMLVLLLALLSQSVAAVSTPPCPMSGGSSPVMDGPVADHAGHDMVAPAAAMSDCCDEADCTVVHCASPAAFVSVAVDVAVDIHRSIHPRQTLAYLIPDPPLFYRPPISR